MRKAQIVSSLFVLAFILIAGIMGANQANAVVCPAGLICIPKDSTLEGCPSGFVCVQNPAYVKPIVTSESSNACYRFTKNLGELDGASGYESTGADVVALQSQLISLGYDIPSVSSGGSARGQFDDDTRYAVMKYQASKGIPSTGFFGPLTRASLNATCLAGNPVSAFADQGNNIHVKWESYKGEFDSYQIIIGNSTLNKEVEVLKNVEKTKTVISTEIPWKFLSEVSGNLSSQSTNYVKVNAIKSDWLGSKIVNTLKSPSFLITPKTSPSPTPTSSNVPVITRINPAEYSKSGQEVTLYGNNLDGTTNIEFFHTDGKVAGGVLPSFVSSEKVVFSLSGLFVENSGYSTYLVSVVTNKCKGGCDSNRVTLRYRDINSSNPNCPAGYICNYSGTSPSPTPTNTPAQPSISFTYPRYAETWYLGETKNVSWTYNNFDSSVSGEKYVELQLVPLDGRSPIVLGTYTAPYGYQPLTIYTKTSTGRDAWLPGEYKLKLVCRSSNVNGFKNCRADAVGYITVKAPTPTPTPASSPVSVNPNNDLNAAIWSAVEEYSRGR